MSIYVEQADYSSLYRALGQRKEARLGLLRVKSQATSDLLAIAEAGIDIANVIYGIAKQKKLAQAKLEAQVNDQRLKQAARDAILNNDYTWEEETAGTNTEGGMGEEAGIGKPTGRKTIKMPDSFEQFYRDAAQQIDENYKGFTEVQSWARDQLYSSYDNAKGTALETAYNQEIKDTAALESTIITNALNDSIESGDFKYTEAAVNSASSLTPTGKKAMLAAAESSFKFGTKDRRVKLETAEKGYDVALATINSWAAAGEVSAEEAEILKKTAATIAQETAAAVQQKAETIFQKGIEGGQSVDSALEIALKDVPAPYRADTETLIRAQYQTRIKIEDDEADREMKMVWSKNENNPAAVLSHLLTAKDQDGKGYAERMTTETYAWWHDRFTLLLASGGSVDSDDICPPDVERELRGIISDNVRYPTNESKLDAVNEIGRRKNEDGSFTVGLKVINSYRTLAGNPDTLDAVVAAGIKRIDSYFAGIASKTKPGSAEERAAYQAATVAKQNLLTFLKQGKRTDQQVNSYVLSLMNTQAVKPLYEDQAALSRGGTAYDRRRAEAVGSKYPGEMVMGGRALTTEEKVAFEEGDQTILVKDYGIAEDNVLQREELPNGLFKYRVKGINPDSPGASYWVTFTDNGKGNERLWIQDSKTGNWIKGDTILTLKQKTAAAEEAARKARVAEEVQRLGATGVNAANLVGMAAKGETTVKEAASIATAGEPVTAEMRKKVAEQLIAYRAQIGRPGMQLRQGEIAQIAKETGLTEAMVLRLVTEAGWQVIQ